MGGAGKSRRQKLYTNARQIPTPTPTFPRPSPTPSGPMMGEGWNGGLYRTLARSAVAKRACDVLLKVGGDASTIYDEMRAYEVADGVAPETYIDIVRDAHSQSSVGRWSKSDIQRDGMLNGSFHCWVEDPDGNIIDPHFPQYDKMMLMNRCDGSRKVYSEWSIPDQIQKLKMLTPRIKRNISENAISNGIPPELMLMVMEDKPQFRCCHVNAFAIKAQNPEYKFKIGNMGFRHQTDPDKIWWEY